MKKIILLICFLFFIQYNYCQTYKTIEKRDFVANLSIDSIKAKHIKNSSTYQMLLLQTQKDVSYPQKDSVRSVLILNNIADSDTKYWIITKDTIITNTIYCKSIFNYPNYLQTGILDKDEDTDELKEFKNAPSKEGLMFDNDYILFVPELWQTNIIYYEDANNKFYFEDSIEPLTYKPIPEREIYRKEWLNLIHNELHKMINILE